VGGGTSSLQRGRGRMGAGGFPSNQKDPGGGKKSLLSPSKERGPLRVFSQGGLKWEAGEASILSGGGHLLETGKVAAKKGLSTLKEKGVPQLKEGVSS